MNKRAKGVFKAESRLFATPFSLFVYFATALFILLAIFYIASNSFVARENPDEDPLFYRQRLEEIEKELQILHDPSLSDEPVIDYEGREEALLTEKALVLQYLQSGTGEEDYVKVSAGWYYIEDGLTTAFFKGQSALSGAINAFPVFALCIAVVCLICGIRRIYALNRGTGAKMKLLCDCSRRQLLCGGMLLDGCVLGALLVVTSVVRAILAFSGSAKRFYIIDGTDVVFGSAHELLLAQFVAIAALGAACYFSGAFVSYAVKGKPLPSCALSVAAIGIAFAVGLTVQYASHDEISFLLATPVFGISFCFCGFRYYVFFVQLALCVVCAALCAARLFFRRKGRALPVRDRE